MLASAERYSSILFFYGLDVEIHGQGKPLYNQHRSKGSWLLATHLIPGCVGREVQLGSESSSSDAAAGNWTSDLGIWKSGNLGIWEPGNLEPPSPPHTHTNDKNRKTMKFSKGMTVTIIIACILILLYFTGKNRFTMKYQ